MGKKIFKIAIVAATVIVVIWAFAALTGNTVSARIGTTQKSRCKNTLRRRRRVNGQLWQPPGVAGPMNTLMQTWQPPVIPVSPIS